jgi:hypothetical protein
MGDLGTRLDQAEEALQPEGPQLQDITFVIVYDECVLDPDTGDVRTVPGKRLPDDQYIFSEYGERLPDGRRFRTAYPKEIPIADHGILEGAD